MPIEILLIEDSAGDVRLTQEAFRDANPLIHLNVSMDGVDGMAFLRRQGDPRQSSSPGPHLTGPESSENGWALKCWLKSSRMPA